MSRTRQPGWCLLRRRQEGSAPPPPIGTSPRCRGALGGRRNPQNAVTMLTRWRGFGSSRRPAVNSRPDSAISAKSGSTRSAANPGEEVPLRRPRRTSRGRDARRTASQPPGTRAQFLVRTSGRERSRDSPGGSYCHQRWSSTCRALPRTLLHRQPHASDRARRRRPAVTASQSGTISGRVQPRRSVRRASCGGAPIGSDSEHPARLGTLTGS